MPSIAITGGIACGKSLVMTSLTNSLGQKFSGSPKKLSFFNADKEVATLLDNDAEVAQEITAAFGPIIYDNNGKADRSRLRSLILTSSQHKKQLEEILHPRLKKIGLPQAIAAQNQPHHFFLAEIPLLFENDLAPYFDCVIVVAASESTQLHRIIKLRHLSRDTALALLDLQLPLYQKIHQADHVIWNDGSEITVQQQIAILNRLF